MIVKCNDSRLTRQNHPWVHLSTEETQNDAHQLVSRDWDFAFQALEVQAAIENYLKQ
jgi:hypothetical protein